MLSSAVCGGRNKACTKTSDSPTFSLLCTVLILNSGTAVLWWYRLRSCCLINVLAHWNSFGTSALLHLSPAWLSCSLMCLHFLFFFCFCTFFLDQWGIFDAARVASYYLLSVFHWYLPSSFFNIAWITCCLSCIFFFRLSGFLKKLFLSIPWICLTSEVC